MAQYLNMAGVEALWGKIKNTFAKKSDLSSYLPTAGGIMTGDMRILFRDTDKFIMWDYDGDGNAGAGWRIGSKGSGSGNTNYFCVESGTSSVGVDVWNNVLNIGQNDFIVYFSQTPKVGSTNVSLEGHTHNYAASSHTHTRSQITDFSHTHSYLPLSGGTLTGMTTIEKSSESSDAIYWVKTTNSNHYLGFGEGTSGNRGIYDQALGWVFKIDTSNNVTLSGTASNVPWSGVTGKPSTFTPSSHTHSYLPLIGGSLSGALTFTGTTAETSWIKFSRENYNYITFPAGYSLAFGTATGSANTLYRMTSDAFFPETTNTKTLGTSSLKWSNVYATTFTGNLTGNVTGNCTGSSSSCTGNTATATAMSSFDVASVANVNRYVWMSWSDNSGKPAYNSNLTFNTSTNTLATVKVSASSGFYQSSDERLKTFHDPIKVDLEKLKTLRKNYFKFNDKDKLEIGVSAQEVQEIYPEIVSPGDNGYLSVAYDKLSVIALSAIDELHEENKQLKSENDELRSRIEAIENILNKLIINQ